MNRYQASTFSDAPPPDKYPVGKADAASCPADALQDSLSRTLMEVPAGAARFAGIGVDLARVGRIRQAVERPDGAGQAFIEKVYRTAEIEYCRAAHFPEERFAALWAIREAAVKALGTGYSDGVGFHDLEIICTTGRAPELKFHGRFAQIAAERGIDDSRTTLSHDRDCVVAVVVLFACRELESKVEA